MACFKCWNNLLLPNKFLLVTILLGSGTLILAFATPFWISVDIPDKMKGAYIDSYTAHQQFVVEVALKNDHHIGLWQWCYGNEGCVDLSLIAKFLDVSEDYKSQLQVNEIHIIKELIDYWITVRVFCTFGFISGITVAGVTLVYIFLFKGQKGRSLAFIMIGSYITAGLLLIAVAIFCGRVHKFLNQWVYLNFSFVMVCVATIIYLINGICCTAMLCRCVTDSARVPQSEPKTEYF